MTLLHYTMPGSHSTTTKLAHMTVNTNPTSSPLSELQVSKSSLTPQHTHTQNNHIHRCMVLLCIQIILFHLSSYPNTPQSQHAWINDFNCRPTRARYNEIWYTHTNMALQTYQHVDSLGGFQFKGISKCGRIAHPSTETLQDKKIAMVTRETNCLAM